MKDIKQWAILSSIPVLILCGLICKFAVDVPFWDEWDYTRYIEKMYSGNLTVYDLWQQHNEHRILFPRLITILNIILFHWNIYLSMAITVLLALCGSYLIYNMICKLDFGDNKKYWLYFIVAWILFSFNQVDNWLWGFQLAFGLAVFASIASIYLLSVFPPTTKIIVFSALAAIISIYSSANGLFIYPVGILIICMGQSVTKEKNVILWSLLVGGASVAYFIDFHFITEHGGFSQNLQLLISNPKQFLIGFSVILARIFIPATNTISVCISVGGLCWQLFLLKKYCQSSRSGLRPYIGILGLGAYSLLVILSIAFGRFSYGGLDASRYIIFSLYFWVSLICQTFCILEQRSVIQINVYKSIASISIIVSLFGSFSMIPYAKERCFQRNWVKQEVLAGNPIDTNRFCSWSYPSVTMINNIKYLKDNHIRNFENACYTVKPDFNRILNNEFELTDKSLATLDDFRFDDNQIFVIRGWCFVTGENNQFNKYSLILKNGDTIFSSSLKNEDRIDVVNAFPNEFNLLHCGFSKSTIAFLDAVNSGEYDLFIGVETPDKKVMCPLKKKVRVP